jgi:hypothetical protein
MRFRASSGQFATAHDPAPSEIVTWRTSGWWSIFTLSGTQPRVWPWVKAKPCAKKPLRSEQGWYVAEVIRPMPDV